MRGRIWLGFSVGIESGVFLCGASKLTVCGAKLTCLKCCDWLGFRVGGVGRNWLGFWMRAANRLVLVLASRLIRFLSGWSIWTWFQCRGSNLTWCQFIDRNLFVLCLGVENDLVWCNWIEIDFDFVWWRSTAKRYGGLTKRCLRYVLQDHSVTVDWVPQ